jgi:hypothetical protein
VFTPSNRTFELLTWDVRRSRQIDLTFLNRHGIASGRLRDGRFADVKRQAKLFECHRLLREIERTEREIKESSRLNDPHSQDRTRELLKDLECLRTQSKDLLAEIERLRS